MTKTRKLTLRAHLREVTGCGDSITWRLRCWRENAAGNYEEYELELETCRGSARHILGELRKMHVRDRDRLAREAARIDREVSELTKEQS